MTAWFLPYLNGGPRMHRFPWLSSTLPVLAAVAIRNPPRPLTATPVAESMHCALDAPPVRT